MALVGSILTRGYGGSNVKLVLRGFGSSDPYSHTAPIPVTFSAGIKDGVSKSGGSDGVRFSGGSDGVGKTGGKA